MAMMMLFAKLQLSTQRNRRSAEIISTYLQTEVYGNGRVGQIDSLCPNLVVEGPWAGRLNPCLNRDTIHRALELSPAAVLLQLERTCGNGEGGGADHDDHRFRNRIDAISKFLEDEFP